MNYNPFFPGDAISIARLLSPLQEFFPRTPATTSQMAKDVVSSPSSTEPPNRSTILRAAMRESGHRGKPTSRPASSGGRQVFLRHVFFYYTPSSSDTWTTPHLVFPCPDLFVFLQKWFALPMHFRLFILAHRSHSYRVTTVIAMAMAAGATVGVTAVTETG